jgi:hypothetical protein
MKPKNGKVKWNTVETVFPRNINGKELSTMTIEGKIVSIEDWTFKKMHGTSAVIQTPKEAVKIPVGGVLRNKLATYLGNGELDYAKCKGLHVRITGRGYQKAKVKGQSPMALVDLAVASS